MHHRSPFFISTTDRPSISNLPVPLPVMASTKVSNGSPAPSRRPVIKPTAHDPPTHEIEFQKVLAPLTHTLLPHTDSSVSVAEVAITIVHCCCMRADEGVSSHSGVGRCPNEGRCSGVVCHLHPSLCVTNARFILLAFMQVFIKVIPAFSFLFFFFFFQTLL